MSHVSEVDLGEVVHKVASWPVDDRLLLVQRILDSIRSSERRDGGHQKTLKDLFGILKIDGEPPTDEECAKIIEEAKMQKYAR